MLSHSERKLTPGVYRRGFYFLKHKTVVEAYLKKTENSEPGNAHKKEFGGAIDKFVDKPFPIDESAAPLDIAAGMSFSVYILANHTVVVDGPAELDRALFLGDPGVPRQLSALVNRVSAGMNHVVAWAPNSSTVISWGCNVNSSIIGLSWTSSAEVCGQLGQSASQKAMGPGMIKNIRGNVLDVACGASHTLVLTNLQLFGCGLNTSHQLTGTDPCYPFCVPIAIPTDVVASQVSCGDHHSMILSEEGHVFCWGWNESGQCGQAVSVKYVSTPSKVKGLKDIEQVAGGSHHSLALKKGGKVLSWGGNTRGELGRRVFGQSHSPSVIDSLPVCVSISASLMVCSAVDSHGCPWVWGALQGEDFLTNARTPRKLAFDGDVCNIKCGFTHNILIAIKKRRSSLTENSEEATTPTKSRMPKLRLRYSEKSKAKRSASPAQSKADEEEESDSLSDVPARSGSFTGSVPASPGSMSEVEERVSSRKANELDLTLVQEPQSEDIVVDYGTPGLELNSVVVHDAYKMYEMMFVENYHFLFVGKCASQNNGKVVAVLRAPDPVKHFYQALMFDTMGILSVTIDEAQVVGKDNVGQPSPRNLAVLLLNFLQDHWGRSSDLSLHPSRKTSNPINVLSISSSPMASPASSPLASPRTGSKRDMEWKHVSSTSDKAHLSSRLWMLESRLAKSQKLNVAVFFHGQQEGLESEAFAKFLRIICSEVSGENWKHHDGGVLSFMNKGEKESPSTLFYTSWRGFEICFHVSTRMSTDMERQFVGNDKAVIHFADANVVVSPEFRGKVNSAAVVVKQEYSIDSFVKDHKKHWPEAESDAVVEGVKHQQKKVRKGWRIACFSRSSVKWKSIVTTSVIKDKNILRDVVLANVINANTAVQKSPPFCHAFRSAMADEVEGLVELFTATSSSNSGKRTWNPISGSRNLSGPLSMSPATTATTSTAASSPPSTPATTVNASSVARSDKRQSVSSTGVLM